MSKTLDMDSFIACWKSFTEDKKTELLSNYDSSEWTKFIVGEKRSTLDGSPFGKYFVDYFGKEYAYRKEDGLVDLSIFKINEFVKDVYKIAKGTNGEKNSLENYPKDYDLLFEHENDPSKAYEEMCKLTYFRAYLKVLVTYIWDPKGDEMWTNTHERLSKNFKTIIKQANQRYPENVETSYILITGQRISDKLIWKYTGFSVMNTLKQTDSYVIVHDWAKANINE